MNDPLILVLTVVSTVLTILLVVVGIQVFLVLQEVKKTLHRANSILDVVHVTVTRTLLPLAGLRGMTSGIRSGLHVVETFVNYLKRHDQEEV